MYRGLLSLLAVGILLKTKAERNLLLSGVFRLNAGNLLFSAVFPLPQVKPVWESAQLIETSYVISPYLGGEFLWWMLLTGEA